MGMTVCKTPPRTSFLAKMFNILQIYNPPKWQKLRKKIIEYLNYNQVYG